MIEYGRDYPPGPDELPEPWEDPGSLDGRTSLPAFPIGALPSPIREYAAALAIATQTPMDMPGTVVLGVLAACVGGRVVVEPVPGWREPTNLYVVPVSEPGTRKSSMAAAAKPLSDAEVQLQATLAPQVADRETEKDILDRYAEKCRIVAGKDPRAEKIAEAQDATRAAAAVVVPGWPRVVIDDATPEALISEAARQGGRIAAISTEAGVFESLTGSVYSSRTNLEPLLKMHAGDPIRVDRRSREPEHIESPALTLAATVQPHALRDFLSRDALGGRGVLARVLWSIVPDNVGYRSNDPAVAKPVPVHVEASYAGRITTLAVELFADEPRNHITLTLDARAQAVLSDYRDQVEAMLRPGGTMSEPLPRQWGAKLAGAAVRIAGCLHSAAGREAFAAPISETTMRAALELAEYYRAHALAAFGARHEEEDSKGRRLLVALVALDARFRSMDPPRPLTMRDARQRLPRVWRDRVGTGDTKRMAFEPVLDVLRDLGWVRITATDTGSKVLTLHPDAEKVATPATPPSDDGPAAGHRPNGSVARDGYAPATPGYTPPAV